MAGARARDTNPAKPISQLSRHGMLLRSISWRSHLWANRLTEEERRNNSPIRYVGVPTASSSPAVHLEASPHCAVLLASKLEIILPLVVTGRPTKITALFTVT